MEIIKKMPAPQVSITLREHNLGADMVTITVLSSSYPEDLLLRQIQTMGQGAGSAPRGVAMGRVQMGSQSAQSFLKATFAVDNIIDRSSGTLNLGAVIHAFMGAPAPHTTSSMMVTFDGEKPNSKTLRSFSDKAVTLAATASEMPPGLEYRVMLHTQDPKLVTIPSDPAEARHRTQAAQGPATSPVMPLPVLILILAGGAALGVLVYFLSLRLPRR
jgi:hypothetical protein